MDQLVALPPIADLHAEDGRPVDFDAFVAGRLPSLVRYAAMLTGSRELAEDVVQDALVKTHSKWRRISTAARPDLYVRKIVTDEFLNWRRRRRLRTVELQAEHTETPHGDRPRASKY